MYDSTQAMSDRIADLITKNAELSAENRRLETALVKVLTLAIEQIAIAGTHANRAEDAQALNRAEDVLAKELAKILPKLEEGTISTGDRAASIADVPESEGV